MDPTHRHKQIQGTSVHHHHNLSARALPPPSCSLGERRDLPAVCARAGAKATLAETNEKHLSVPVNQLSAIARVVSSRDCLCSPRNVE